MAFRVTDADVACACTIGNRAVASRGSSRLSPRRKSKEPLSRRVAQLTFSRAFQQLLHACFLSGTLSLAVFFSFIYKNTREYNACNTVTNSTLIVLSRSFGKLAF